MKKSGKILLIGLLLFGISSLITFSWQERLPQDYDSDSPYTPSYLCVHPFGFPLKFSTWENHCLPQDLIILSQAINLGSWIVLAWLGYLVVINYKKFEAKLGAKGFILLPLILLIGTAIVVGSTYILSFIVWILLSESL